MKKLYRKPSIKEIALLMEGCIAGSPNSGGNEDVGYEDWPVGPSGVMQSNLFN